MASHEPSVAMPKPGTLVHLPRPTQEPATADPRLSDVDEWGRSERMRQLARTLFGPVYRNWFRAEWEGLDKIPASGGALLVANHAGAVPSDAPVIMHGIETELDRPVYGLADHLVLVFPEGSKGPGKTYDERYRLRRFGRGGFVEIAMRSGVPIIPIAVVGAEESMPIVFKLPNLANRVGLPYVPITANHLIFGPALGTLLYFPAKFKLRVLDPVYFDVPPDEDRYSKSRVMEEAESIRISIQENLYHMLRTRRSVWFG